MKGLLLHTKDWLELWGDLCTTHDLKEGLHVSDNSHPYNSLKVWWVNGAEVVCYDINPPNSREDSLINFPTSRCSMNNMLHNFIEFLSR